MRPWRSLRALLFVTASLTAARMLHAPIDRLLARLPREFFLLGAFSFLVGMAAWLTSSASRARSAR